MIASTFELYLDSNQSQPFLENHQWSRKNCARYPYIGNEFECAFENIEFSEARN